MLTLTVTLKRYRMSERNLCSRRVSFENTARREKSRQSACTQPHRMEWKPLFLAFPEEGCETGAPKEHGPAPFLILMQSGKNLSVENQERSHFLNRKTTWKNKTKQNSVKICDLVLPLWAHFLLSLTLFIYLPCSAACGISLPQSGIKPAPPAVEARSPIHRTAKEIPSLTNFKLFSFCCLISSSNRVLIMFLASVLLWVFQGAWYACAGSF